MDPDAPFRPQPVHVRLLTAYEQAFQEGKNPHDGVIAEKLGVRRETICRWRRRNPKLRRWLYDMIGRDAEDRRPFVDRRVTHLAEAGSVDHAKLYYQFVAKVGIPGGDGGGDGALTGIVVTNNFLVPRPDYDGALAAQQTPAPALPPASKIPVVYVR